MFLEIWVDEIATPLKHGGFVRRRPARITISAAGLIQQIDSLSKSKLSSRSRKIKRERVVVPGLVDCHTHLIFGGDRAHEWNLRLQGESYEAIAKRGGGILNTVQATRASSKAVLKKLGQERLEIVLKHGVTTIEIKSGYGLNLATEIKILEVIKELKKTSKLELVPTFMGAHTRPEEFSNNKDYIDVMIRDWLPKIKGLAEFQDVFCERGNFTEEESIKLLEAGKKFGLKPRVHAHEFARTGGVEAACKVGAISADHLMVMNDEDISAMKKSNVIPVILPGTSFFLGGKEKAPARKMWDAGLKVAIGSDFNPGTNPTLNFPLCGTIAASQQGLNLEEVLTAQTWHAALALNRRDRGCIEPGMRADLVAIDGQSFEEIYYSYGISKVTSVYIGGKTVL